MRPWVAVFESVAVSFDADDLGLVDEAVDHRGGDHVAAEHLSPASEWLVAGHDEALVPSPRGLTRDFTCAPRPRLERATYC
jgi:hypothetical protein